MLGIVLVTLCALVPGSLVFIAVIFGQIGTNLAR